MSDPTEGSRDWTQRFLNFGFLSVCAIAEIAWLSEVRPPLNEKTSPPSPFFMQTRYFE
jgi:hypothetical protein